MTMFHHMALLSALALSAPAAIQTAAAQPSQPAGKERAAGFGNFGASKEPIKIDADQLDVYDKEGRAVFTGNVVAVQGDSTMNCTLMTVLYEQKRDGQNSGPAAPGADDSAIKKIDCKGPVTIVSKTQVATGDNASFDRVANKIYLIGNAALSDGPNVTRGERVVYDLNTGVANVETKPGGRVRALFVPGSGTEGKPAAPGGAAAPAAKPKPQKPATN
ncbi:LptA/OstA family protein [Microvirga rosea]|uniref:LptA/OstA family protein n=1 Tax=Microvirga rosea TaxID=2715425 RepID=UPI001D09D25B|nr:LptA/OstA family protein [Microvirga rosea]MCB8819328.1 organic solvent tolerance protein OstA [Microvirga rosea]